MHQIPPPPLTGTFTPELGQQLSGRVQRLLVGNTVGKGAVGRQDGICPLGPYRQAKGKGKLTKQSQSRQRVARAGRDRAASAKVRSREGRGVWARRGKGLGGLQVPEDCEGEKVAPSKEPEFSLGEAVEASRDVRLDLLLFQIAERDG